ncbi:MAG: 50S ribosomal protein L29 [Planctomycetes bacterium]|nr:50S ribosomal protein L29 [Planctomycetota bacterium]
MKFSEFRNLTDTELKQELLNLKKRLFRIRENMVIESSGELKEHRMLKKDISRIHTLLKERETGHPKTVKT